MRDQLDLLGAPRPRLAAHLDAIGVGAHHASRVFRGLHRSGLALSEIPDLGRHAAVIEASTWRAVTELCSVHEDAGTEKLVMRLHDGAKVESVLIPMRDDRLTLCVSSQVGCAMACAFCATGTLGLTRGLEPGEIVSQVHRAREHAALSGRRVTRIVFMGMGEPLHHYDATRDALRVLLDDHGLSFGSRSVTVSTVGLVPKMKQFAEDFRGRVPLAISLHAGTDETRRKIVPVAGVGSMAALREVVAGFPFPTSRKLMVEYVVLPGVNDGDADLTGLAEWMRGVPGVVNLIPFNPFAGSAFRSPSVAEVERVYAFLQGRKVPATIRWPRGRGAHGACGQLALVQERQGLTGDVV